MSYKQRLELNWIGKDNLKRLEPRLLLENNDLSLHGDNCENVLIHGDNLLSLKALENDYRESIKCIYIDPPYNTGNAFEHYDDGLERSIWLSLMKPRLELLWELLKKDGSIWISIDDGNVHYLRVLLDELYGSDKFITSIVWQKRYSRENREAIGDVHEYVIVYAKNPKIFKENRNKQAPTDKQKKIYKNSNNDPNGPWRAIPITAQEGHATKNQYYEIVAPGGKKFRPPEGRCWGISEDTFKQKLKEGRIYFGKDNNSQPNLIRYFSEVDGVVPWTWWPHEEVGHTDEAKKEIHELFGKEKAFDTPKPERLLKRIIEIATNPGDIILDSFAGTGTTGAVAHKMGRKWIMIEMGDHAKDLIRKRLEKVITASDGLKLSEDLNWNGGGGFTFYELAPSLLQKDDRGNWIINNGYNATRLAEAVCKHEKFKFHPDETIYWKQGYSSERDFIFVTTQFLTSEHLDRIQSQMKRDESLLICAKAFRIKKDKYPNIMFKKIPQMLLGRCEFAKDNYSLNIVESIQPELEMSTKV